MMPEEKLLDGLFRELHPVKENRLASQREEMIQRCRHVFGPTLTEWAFLCSEENDEGRRKRYKRSYERLIAGRDDFSFGITPLSQSLAVVVATAPAPAPTPAHLPPHLDVSLDAVALNKLYRPLMIWPSGQDLQSLYRVRGLLEPAMKKVLKIFRGGGCRVLSGC